MSPEPRDAPLPVWPHGGRGDPFATEQNDVVHKNDALLLFEPVLVQRCPFSKITSSEAIALEGVPVSRHRTRERRGTAREARGHVVSAAAPVARSGTRLRPSRFRRRVAGVGVR